MNILLIAFSSFVIAFSGALVPGPLFTITVSETIKKGKNAGPLIILGHGVLELSVVLLVLFGLSPLLSSTGARLTVSVAGGAALIVMGLITVWDARRTRMQIGSSEGNTSRGLILAGIAGSASNPYWIIWWATIGLGYLGRSLESGGAGVAAFFIGHISADLLWYSLVSFSIARGREVMGESVYRYMLYACGVFMVIFGGWFLWTA